MNFLRRNHFTTLICLIFALALIGCGNKGDLYIPTDETPADTQKTELGRSSESDTKD